MIVLPWRNVPSLLLSEKANALAHGSIGARGGMWTNGLLALSAILGYIAGFSGLASLVTKTLVSIIALAAGLSTTCLILRLTMSNPNAHRQAQAKYDLLYLRTIGCDEKTPEGMELFNKLWADFMSLIDEVNRGPVALTPRQVRRFEKKAREELSDVLPNEDTRVNAMLVR